MSIRRTPKVYQFSLSEEKMRNLSKFSDIGDFAFSNDSQPPLFGKA